MAQNSPSAPQLGVVSATNGVFRFALGGLTGGQYIVQASSNLQDWTTLGTYTVPPAGSLMTADSMNGHAKRFFRAVTQGQGPLVFQPGPENSKDIWTWYPNLNEFRWQRERS